MIKDLEWQQPALLGGLIVGILSATPIVSTANCLCCAWAVIGGLVASRMVINASPRQITNNDGLQIGALAGAIGIVAFLVVSVPIVLSGVATKAALGLMETMMSRISNPQVQEALSETIAVASGQTAMERLLSAIPVLVLQSILQAAFAAIGGLIGVVIFEKRGPMVPAPPTFAHIENQETRHLESNQPGE